MKTCMTISTVLLLLQLMMSSPTFAEGPGTEMKPGIHDLTYISEVDETEQPFQLFIPTAAEDSDSPLPLVVVLHGHGANWKSWFAATDVTEWGEKHGYVVLSPQGRGNFFYRSLGEKDVFDTIDEAKTKVNIDNTRIYLMGHSMGGWGTWHLATSYPDFWAGIAPMAGWAPLDKVSNLGPLDPIVIHGDKDEAVDFQHGIEASKALSEEGISHRFIRVRGAGHESSLISDYLETIHDHFAMRQKPAPPEKILHRTYLPQRGQAWWIGILDMRTEGSIAEIEAEIKGNEIRVVTENVSALAIYTEHLPEEVPAELNLILQGSPKGVVETDSGKIYALNIENNYFSEMADTEIDKLLVPKVIGPLKTPHEDWLKRAGSLISGRHPNAHVLLTETFLLPESTGDEVDSGTLIDLYVRPNASLVLGSIPESQLIDILDNQEEWRSPWWKPVYVYPELKGNSRRSNVTVLLPYDLYHLLKENRLLDPPSSPFVPFSQTIREILLDEVKKEGSF